MKTLNVNVNFNLEGLMKITQQATEMEQAAIKQEEYIPQCENTLEKFFKIVQGVSRKYASKWVSSEDLEQELWIKVLEMIEAVGGNEEDLDEALVAKACFRKAVDYYRYCRRRYEANTQLFEEGESEDRADGQLEYDPSKLLKTHGLVNQESHILVQEVLELFPEGSKERKYAEAKLYAHGLLDEEVYGRKFDLPESPKSHTNVDDEIDYCAYIGYNPRKISGSWIVKKKQMRELVDEYLGRR